MDLTLPIFTLITFLLGFWLGRQTSPLTLKPRKSLLEQVSEATGYPIKRPKSIVNDFETVGDRKTREEHPIARDPLSFFRHDKAKDKNNN